MSAMGVIVLASCVSVSVSLSWPNGQTYRLEFWHVGQVEEYLGQVGHRSKVKVTRSKMFLWLIMDVSMRMHGEEEISDEDISGIEASQ